MTRLLGRAGLTRGPASSADLGLPRPPARVGSMARARVLMVSIPVRPGLEAARTQQGATTRTENKWRLSLPVRMIILATARSACSFTAITTSRQRAAVSSCTYGDRACKFVPPRHHQVHAEHRPAEAGAILEYSPAVSEAQSVDQGIQEVYRRRRVAACG